MRNKAGAPKGGRVHWFLMRLDNFVRARYSIEFDYDKHDYRLELKDVPKKRIDEYLIKRTSAKHWVVIYFDRPTKRIEHTTYKNSNEVVDYLLYMIPRKIAQEEEYEQTAAALKYKHTTGNPV